MSSVRSMIFLIQAMVLCACVADSGLGRSDSESPSREMNARTNVQIFEDKSSFVVIEISIKNTSNSMLCIPHSYFALDPWPFEVSDPDDAGEVVHPRLEMIRDDFGYRYESFYVLGKNKILIKRLSPGSVIDFPQGRFKIKWQGFAFDCDDIAKVAGYYNDMSRLPSLSLTGSAELGD